MNNKYCENCGSVCKATDTYCRICNASLLLAADDSYKSINGISTSELNLLIDKNAGRYMEVFADNEEKKVFLNFNWMSFLFPEIWLLYRKMYLYFALKLITTILVVILALIGTISYCSYRIEEEKEGNIPKVVLNTDRIENLRDDIKAKYLEDFKFAAEHQTPFIEQTPVLVNIVFYGTIILTNFIFALFADCLYRRYLIKHYEYYCGTSIIAASVGIVIMCALLLPEFLFRFSEDFSGILNQIVMSFL